MSAIMRGAMQAATVCRVAQVTSGELRTASSFLQTRSFSRTSNTFDAESQTARAGVRMMRKPSDFDKKTLVWAKLYPTKESIPDEVSERELIRARDWCRVRTVTLMVIASFFLTYGAIRYGRRLRNSGDNLQERGEAWVLEQQAIGRERREKEKSA